MLNNETIPVGKLWSYFRKGRTSAGFEYDKKWLSNKKRFALEPALQLTEGSHYADKALFGAIGDSAPDRWGRILMQRFNKTGQALSEIDYLLGVSDEARQGALRFSESLDNRYLAITKRNSIPPMLKLPELLSASEKILSNTEKEEDLKLLLIPGSSLGGARPKASVFDKDGTLAIAKFPRKADETDIVRWEAVALTLAKTAGINVPEWRLEKVLEKYVLIINRFDRNNKTRIPFLSAMSMLGASDNDGLLHNFTEIANALIQYGAQPDKDMEEIWRRVVFGILISNTDNHLRNHGFLFSNTGWVLSPVYDINPSIEKSDFSIYISETFGSSIDEALLAARDFRLSELKAKIILDEVETAVADWRKVAKSLGLSSRSIDVMKTAFKI